MAKAAKKSNTEKNAAVIIADQAVVNPEQKLTPNEEVNKATSISNFENTKLTTQEVVNKEQRKTASTAAKYIEVIQQPVIELPVKNNQINSSNFFKNRQLMYYSLLEPPLPISKIPIKL